MKPIEEKLAIARRLSRITDIAEIRITNNTMALTVTSPDFYHSIKGVSYLDYKCKNGVIFILKK